MLLFVHRSYRRRRKLFTKSTLPRTSFRTDLARHVKQTAQVLYEAELTMFGSDKQLLLVDGDYELAMNR